VATGCRVWPAAYVLSEFLIRTPQAVRGRRVIELGAGTGMCGMVAAAACRLEGVVPVV
jgi:predicted nicotinamide N-methyase